MEQLLDDYCLIERLHQDTEDSVDFFTFKQTAWCARPESLPAFMDLHVVEPLAAAGEELISLHILIYPISVKVISRRQPLAGLPTSPSPANFGDREE